MIQATMKVDLVHAGDQSSDIYLRPLCPIKPDYCDEMIPHTELKLTIVGSEMGDRFKLGQLYLVNMIRLAEKL